MADDDFKIAEEENEFKLQPDAQFGLKFAHDDSQNDAYALSSTEYDAASSTTNAALSGSTNDAPTIKPPQSAEEPDVYGIVEPTPSPDLQEVKIEQNRVEPGAKPVKAKKAKSKKSNDDFDDESVSLEEVYERKRREREQYGDETYANMELPPLPARPFWDGIFKPFCDPGFLVRALAAIGAAFVPLFLAVYFLDYFFADDVKEMLTHADPDGGMDALNAFYECVWRDKIIIALLCIFWGVFAFPFAEHVFVSTATGSDKIEDWPEYSIVSGLGSLLLFALYVLIACIPGVLVCLLLGIPRNVGGLFTALCFTPIFILSSMQNDAPFAILSKDVLIGVKRLQREWLKFWGISLIVVLVCLILELFAVWYSVNPESANPESIKPQISRVAVSAFVLSSVAALGPTLYFRFLGRFAWVLETDFRKRQEEEEEQEENDKEK